MTRGNQRELARAKNLKKEAKSVSQLPVNDTQQIQIG